MNANSCLTILVTLFLSIIYVSAQNVHYLAKREAFADPNPGPEPSLSTFTTQKCEEKMEPLYKNITTTDQNLNSSQFCNGLAKGVEVMCSDIIHSYCENVPWNVVRYACKEYMPGWICAK